MSGASPLDTSRYKVQSVRVYTPAGAFVDTWRDAPLLAGFKESINSATSPMRVVLPRSFDDYDEAGTVGARGSIAQGNIVQYWLHGPGLPTSGLLRFQGVIDKYEPQISETGQETLTVTLTPRNAIVGDNGITGTQQFGTPGSSGTYVDPVTMFNYWFSHTDPNTGLSYVSPLTLDGTNPASSGVTSQYTFTQQNMLSIFNTCIQLLPINWFWRPNPDNTATLNVAPVTAQHQFILGRHIVAPTYGKDWTGLKNYIQVIGATLTVSLTAARNSGTAYTTLAVTPVPVALPAGQTILLNNTPAGAASQALTTSGTTAAGATTINVNSFTANATYPAQTPVGIPVSSVQLGSDLATFGPRFEQVVDSRITDTATAQGVGQYLLNTLDVTSYRFKLRIVDYRGDSQSGLGYDIETIKPGQTAQIVNPAGQSGLPLWDQARWDVDYWDGSPGSALNQVVIIQALTYNFDSVDLELAALAPSQARRLIALANQFGLYTSAY